MLALAILIVIVAGGWLGWSYWLAIPFGYALFAATFYGRYDEALKHKNSAWLTAPATALIVMWLVWNLHSLIG